MEVSSPTASSALMGPSSTNSISSVIGGSMWTALKQSHSMDSMIKLLLKLQQIAEVVEDLEEVEEGTMQEVEQDQEEDADQEAEDKEALIQDMVLQGNRFMRDGMVVMTGDNYYER